MARIIKCASISDCTSRIPIQRTLEINHKWSFLCRHLGKGYTGLYSFLLIHFCSSLQVFKK